MVQGRGRAIWGIKTVKPGRQGTVGKMLRQTFVRELLVKVTFEQGHGGEGVIHVEIWGRGSIPEE